MLRFLPIEKLDKISCLHLLCVRATLAARGFFDISSHCFTHLKGGGTWRAVALPESDRDQERRLRHPIAIVLVKCLTGYETKGSEMGVGPSWQQ